MKRIILPVLMLLCTVLFDGCKNQKTQAPSRLFFEEKFDDGFENWVIEQQPGGKSFIGEYGLEVIDSAGCTIWLRKKLTAPLKIEYTVEVIDMGGEHDRVSDLNCFWMANDPVSLDDFFKNSEIRGGKFANYHTLKQYYVGYGGHNNSKTRFRRYDGNVDRPLLPEHDLSDPKYMIMPNQEMRIELTVVDGVVRYLRDGEVVFELDDPNPYENGYFGFRTVNNHMIVKNFKVWNK